MPRAKLWTVCLLVIGLAGCKQKPDAGKLVAQGDELAAKKDWAKAADAYSAASRITKTDGPLLKKLTDARLRAGQARNALEASLRAAEAMPDDEAAQVTAGQLLLLAGSFDDAKLRMLKFVAKHPASVPATIVRANAAANLTGSTQALLVLGQSRNSEQFNAIRLKMRKGATPDGDAIASDIFQEALKLQTDEKAVDAQMAMANFLWASGKPAEAEPILKEVADAHPDHRIANQVLGEYYLMSQRAADGEAYLRRAAGLPDGFPARRQLYDFLIRSNRTEDAEALLSKMLAADDATGGVSLRLAKMRFAAGKREEAMTLVDGLLGRKLLVPEASALKSGFLLASGNQVQALTLAREAAAASPNLSETRFALGRALEAAGDLEDAYDEFVEAAKLDVTATDPLVASIRLGAEIGKVDEALASGREAVRIDPNDREAILALAGVLAVAKDYAGAEAALKPLVAREPGAADVMLQTAVVLAGKGNDDAARAAFGRALQASPDSFEAVSGLVSLDLKARRIPAAKERADAALAKHPKDGAYLELAARAYQAAGDVAHTQATLRQALEAMPGNASAALALARSLSVTQPDDARQVLERFLEHRPKSAEAHKLLERLPSRRSGD